MNSYVNAEINKIFLAFNHRFFGDKLPLPLFQFSRCKYTNINTNIVAKNKDKYSHELHLPQWCLNETIDIVAMYVLEAMIREYAFINDIKLFSRNGSYANKRFASMAASFGLTLENTKTKRGFIVHSNDVFKKICEEEGFKKTWGKIYEHNNGRQSGSTIKYYDPITKESVRATKEHFLICFDECPDVGEQVEKIFNKKRMILED